MFVMNSEKSRIINFRAFAFGALVAIASVFFTFKCFDSLFYLIPFGLFVVGFCVYLIIFKRFYKLIYFFGVAIVFTGSLLISVFTYNDFSIDNKTIDMSGRVCQIYSSSENHTSVIVENLKVENKSLSGKMLLTIYNCDDIDIGDKISYTCKAKSYDVFKLVKDNYSFYKNNVKYRANVNISKCTIKQGSLTFVEKYKLSTKDNLINVMGSNSGGVAYALLFGDKTLIDEDIYTLFASSGTAHLLAISGLHISVIIGLLYFLIKKIKIKNIFKFLIMFVVLGCYCYLCDFSVSVVRASIMGLVLIGTSLAGYRYDSLNSLGLACMIILLFLPLALFNAGFLLSFVAVFAIILFAKVAEKFGIKNKILKKIVASIFTTFVVTLMTYPICASFFKEFSLYTIFANLLVIPIFSVAFVLVLAFHLFAYLGLNFLLFVPKVLFEVVFAINNFFAKLPFATIKTTAISLIVTILIFVLCFVISRFVMLKAKGKAIVCSVIYIVCLAITFATAIINTKQSFAYFDTEIYDCILVDGNNNYLISPDISKTNNYNIKDSLKSKNIIFLKGIIFRQKDNFEVKQLQNFLRYFDDVVVYIPAGHKACANLKSSKVDFVEYGDNLVINKNLQLSTSVLGDGFLTNIVFKNKIITFVSNINIEDFEKINYNIDYLVYEEMFDNIFVSDIIIKEKHINF